MNLQPRANSPKIDMRVSLSAHMPFDDEEIAAAKANMVKGLEAQNVPADEIAARVERAFVS